MGRGRNTDSRGANFPESVIAAVWAKGTAVSGQDANVYRKDKCGAWIRGTEHGNTNSEYGWEVDHIKPVAAGGGDDLANLQPLRWQNNRGKGDSFPNWSCTIGSK